MGIYKKYFNKYKFPFLAAILCVACEAICDLLVPTLMSNIINLGISEGQISKVYSWGALMLMVTLFGAGFAVTRNILASRVSQRVGADLRYDLFEKIIYFSEQSVDKIESGSLITRMTNDTTQVTQFINGIMRIFMKAPITCIGSIILASMLNFKLSLIIYGIVAVVSVLIIISMKLSYPRYSILQKAMDKVNSVVQEYLIGVRLVKAFGTYDQESDKFEDANVNLMQKKHIRPDDNNSHITPDVPFRRYRYGYCHLRRKYIVCQRPCKPRRYYRLYRIYGTDSFVLNHDYQHIQHLCKDKSFDGPY